MDINTLFKRPVDFFLASRRREDKRKEKSRTRKTETLRKVWGKLAKHGSDSSAASSSSEQEKTSVTTTRPPCLCTTDPLHQGRTAIMDPVLARGYHNLTCSRLSRLPEDILLNIMGRLPTIDRHHLRHTSRIFLRLQESRPFGPWSASSIYPWNVPQCYTNAELRRQLHPPHGHGHGHESLYGFCDACRQAHTRWRTPLRRRWLWNHLLFCSGCNLFHPRALFSAGQRRHADRRTRVCQACEGTVRLCRHRTVDVFQVRMALQAALQQHGENRRLRGSTATRISVLLADCEHASHRRSAAHHAAMNPQLSAPKMILVVDTGSLRATLVHKWVGHLEFAASSSPSPSSSFPPPDATHAVLRHRIERELRPGAAEYIVPRLGSGELLEMHCVDPVRCDCLAMPGREFLPHGWRLPANPATYKPMRCRTGAADGLWAGKTKTRDENRSGESSAADDWPCHQAAYWRNDRPVDGISRVSVEMACCRRPVSLPACIQVRYTSSIDVMDLAYRAKGGIGIGHLLPTWYLALDPCSYDLRRDKLGLGFTWCDNPECKLYVHRLRHPVMHMEDVHWYRQTVCGRPGRLHKMYPEGQGLLSAR